MSLAMTPSRTSSYDSDELTLAETSSDSDWYDPAYLAARRQYARSLYLFTEQMWQQERIKIERRSSTGSNESLNAATSPASELSKSSLLKSSLRTSGPSSQAKAQAMPRTSTIESASSDASASTTASGRRPSKAAAASRKTATSLSKWFGL
ncbi:hypothetical protein ACM66B_006182 [Microbotryomycetes sp. NB124-2]